MSLVTKHKHTYEEYRKLPDALRVELIDGEFIMSPSPAYPHQRVSVEILAPLKEWVRRHDLGEVLSAPMDVCFPRGGTVQPDLLFIEKKRLRIIHRNKIQGAPDFIVEILSPTSEFRDLNEKRLLYEKHGVREYWVVDPEKKSVTVMRLHQKTYKLVEVYYRSKDVIESSVVKGFRLAVSEVFRSFPRDPGIRRGPRKAKLSSYSLKLRQL